MDVSEARPVVDVLRDRARDLLADVEELLTKHSKISRRDTRSSAFVVIAPHPYKFEKLPREAQKIQTRALRKLAEISDLAHVVFKDGPSETRQYGLLLGGILRPAIEQSEATGDATIDEVLKRCRGMIEMLEHGLASLPDWEDTADVLLVPDTNAFLYNTRIDTWKFDGIKRMTILLVPAVVSELDEKKAYGNDKVRPKAETMIRQIEEYRRRGRLVDGVDIVRNHIRLRAIGTEPDVKQSLSWLTADNKDDRLLASVIEIVRQHARTPVCVVTRDTNLRNKAELAGVAFAEPPEPVTE